MLGKKEQQPERDLINDQLEREYADATEANRQALCDEIERLTAESRVVSDELKRVDDARSPAIELRHKRETAASAERDRRNAERELAREHEEQSKLAAQIEQHEQHIPRLEHELQQVPYDEALHQKLIGLLPLAQQLERAERDQCAKVQDKAEKSRDLSEAEKKLQAAKRKYDDAAEKHSIAEQAHVAAKEKFSALREKYGSVDMVNHVAGESSASVRSRNNLGGTRKNSVPSKKDKSYRKVQHDLAGAQAESAGLPRQIQAAKLVVARARPSRLKT